ncbi:MAG: DUF2478 domain-containing protein [Rhizobiales bacterium]|nr:DUF2478 domain-containing protein [Hyphomicrobiales bacterium]
MIAAIANAGGPDAQIVFTEAAATWRKLGLRVAGTIAVHADDEGPCSAGFLLDIGSGERYAIRLDEAPAGTACHLDAAGMEEACAALLGQIPSADVVVLSKFGKLEAMRLGLWGAFSASLEAGKPLLTSVSPKHLAAWKAFAPEATWVDADPAAIEEWRRTAANPR